MGEKGHRFETETLRTGAEELTHEAQVLTHGVLNALSVFGREPDYRTQCFISLALIVIAAAYAAYLLRRPALTSGEACVTMEENTEGD